MTDEPTREPSRGDCLVFVTDILLLNLLLIGVI